MKVNGSDMQAALELYKTAQTQVKPTPQASSGASASATTSPAAHQDRLAISDQGRAVTDAQRLAQTIPDVREPLVSEIRSDVAAGTYSVDNQKSAEGILRESMVNLAAMQE